MFLYTLGIFRKQGGKAVKRVRQQNKTMCHGCMSVMTELLVLYCKAPVRNGSVC